MNRRTQGKRGGIERENEEEYIEKRPGVGGWGGGSFTGLCIWAPVQNQPMPCQFHAQQPTGEAAVCF